MISNYTETLNEFITQGGNVHKDKFDLLPTFTVGNQTYNMYDLFITRYGLREIGAETEELFSEYLSIKLDEINIKYTNKINLYVDNFNNLMKRSVELERHANTTYGKQIQDEDYLNPITTNNAKLQNFTKEINSGADKLDENYQQVYSYFKSNPEIMKQAMEIENIYYKALDEFNILFMGVY